jgi:hypothetical protein
MGKHTKAVDATSKRCVFMSDALMHHSSSSSGNLVLGFGVIRSNRGNGNVDRRRGMDLRRVQRSIRLPRQLDVRREG